MDSSRQDRTGDSGPRVATGRTDADQAQKRPVHDTPCSAENFFCNCDKSLFAGTSSSLWAHPITQQCLSRGDPAQRIIGKAKRHRGSVSIKDLPSRTIGPRASIPSSKNKGCFFKLKNSALTHVHISLQLAKEFSCRKT